MDYGWLNLTKGTSLKRLVCFHKRQVSIPRESLMESLLRMDYESSTGNIRSALAHLEEAQNKHDLLFNDTLKNYLDLLISVGINPESLQYANRRGEFTHYYELFLRDSNLNLDIKTYTVPTISRAWRWSTAILKRLSS